MLYQVMDLLIQPIVYRKCGQCFAVVVCLLVCLPKYSHYAFKDVVACQINLLFIITKMAKIYPLVCCVFIFSTLITDGRWSFSTSIMKC